MGSKNTTNPTICLFLCLFVTQSNTYIVYCVTCVSGRCVPGAGLAVTPSSEPRYSCTSQTSQGME